MSRKISGALGNTFLDSTCIGDESRLDGKDHSKIRLPLLKIVSQFKVESEVAWASLSPDDRCVFVQTWDDTSNVFDIKKTKMIAEISHEFPIRHAEFSPDAKFIVISSKHTPTKIYNLSSRKFIEVPNEEKSDVSHATFSPDSRYVVIATYPALIYDVIANRLIRKIDPMGYMEFASFSPCGRYIVTAEGKGSRIFDMKQGKIIAEIKNKKRTRRAKFSPNGKYVVSTLADTSSRIYEIDTWKEIANIQHLRDQREDMIVHRTQVEFSPDSRYLMTTELWKNTKIFDIKSNNLILEIPNVNHAEFSPQSDHVAMILKGNIAKILHVETGKSIFSMKYKNTVDFVCFSPDGRYIATASKFSNDSYKSYRIIDWKKQKIVAKVDHTGGSSSLPLFSSDSKNIVTVCDDTIKISRL